MTRWSKKPGCNIVRYQIGQDFLAKSVHDKCFFTIVTQSWKASIANSTRFIAIIFCLFFRFLEFPCIFTIYVSAANII